MSGIRPAALAAAGFVLMACGAESPSAPPSSPPVAVATPEPTPVPTVAPTPTPEPTAEPRRIFPGPVHHVHIKVHGVFETESGRFRAPFQRNGAWIVYVGETAIIDATPKNAREQPCEYDGPPEWSWEEHVFSMKRVASPNPFLLWMETVAPGVTAVRATVDGAPSNVLEIEVHER